MNFPSSGAGLSAAQTAKLLTIAPLAAPRAASVFTVTSGGGTTLTPTDIAASDGFPASLRFSKPAEATDHLGRAQVARTTETIFEACVIWRGHSSAFGEFGILLWETGGKLAVFGLSYGNTLAGLVTRGFTATSDTLAGAATWTTNVQAVTIGAGTPCWIKVGLTAGTGALAGYVSPGPQKPSSGSYIQVASLAAGFWTGTAPDYAGYAMLAPTGASEVGVADVISETIS